MSLLCQWCDQPDCKFFLFVLGFQTGKLRRHMVDNTGAAVLENNKETHDKVLQAIQTSTINLGALCSSHSECFVGRELIIDLDFPNPSVKEDMEKDVKLLFSRLCTMMFKRTNGPAKGVWVDSSAAGVHLWILPFAEQTSQEISVLAGQLRAKFPSLAPFIDFDQLQLTGLTAMPGSHKLGKLYAIREIVSSK